MPDEPDDSSINGGPAIEFKDIDWTGPVVVPGPVSYGIIDAYGSDTDTVDHRLEQSAVDSPVSTSPVYLIRTSSTIGEGISEGRIRDSLELPKYLPPNPLGVRRASQAGSATAAAAAAAAVKPAAAVEKPPTMPSEVFTFRVPTTMLRGDEGHQRRGLPSYALNVVQPYPNPSGLKKKRAAPINLGALPERLLKRPKSVVAVPHMLDGSVITVIKVPGDEPQGEESKPSDVKPGDAKAGNVNTGDVNAAKAPAEEPPRRFRPVAILARKMRKVKAKAKSAAPEPKGKALEYVETGESARGKEDLTAYERQAGAA